MNVFIYIILCVTYVMLFYFIENTFVGMFVKSTIAAYFKDAYNSLKGLFNRGEEYTTLPYEITNKIKTERIYIKDTPVNFYLPIFLFNCTISSDGKVLIHTNCTACNKCFADAIIYRNNMEEYFLIITKNNLLNIRYESVYFHSEILSAHFKVVKKVFVKSDRAFFKEVKNINKHNKSVRLSQVQGLN